MFRAYKVAHGVAVIAVTAIRTCLDNLFVSIRTLSPEFPNGSSICSSKYFRIFPNSRAGDLGFAEYFRPEQMEIRRFIVQFVPILCFLL